MKTDIRYYQDETVSPGVSINSSRKRPLYWAELELSRDGPCITVFRDSLEEVQDVLLTLSQACLQAISASEKENPPQPDAMGG